MGAVVIRLLNIDGSSRHSFDYIPLGHRKKAEAIQKHDERFT